MKVNPSQIEKWVARHFEYKKRSRGRQLVICNPFDGDTGWHFWISLERTRSKRDKIDYWVHDFRPGHGPNCNFVNFVRQYKNISYYDALKDICGSASDAREALRELRNQQQAQYSHEPEEEPEERLLELPEGASLVAEGSGRIYDLVMNYLNRRLISEKMAKENYLYYTSASIIFPYLEYGMIVYWQERSILGKEFKFPDESKTGLSKTSFIYGFDNVEPNEPIIITEAIFDALTIGSNSVATGGADISDKQVRKIRALGPSEIILAPDNDKAGINSLKANWSMLRPHFNKLKYCLPPTCGEDLKDWNDYDKKMGGGWSRAYIKDHKRDLNNYSKLFPRVESIDVQASIGMG